MAHTSTRAAPDPGTNIIRFPGHGPAYFRCPRCGDRYAAILCPICKIPIAASITRSAEKADPIDNDSRYPLLFYV